MKQIVRILIWLILISASSHRVWASHIVGGVIYYEHLGGTKYKLIFEIYRDCSPGVQVGFDGSTSSNPNMQLPPFYFSIFRGNVNQNIAYNYNELKLVIPVIKIQPVIVNPCLKIDANTCVEKGVFETIVDLPSNSEGYTVQHMRCCRNDGILNIRNQSGSPDKPGITLRTYIPPPGSTPNNSARFSELPPIFICANQTFYFDHKATDKDGDVLRYSLSTPLAGLNSDKPVDKEQTLNVSPIEWSNGYSLNNILGGTPALSIDSITGLLVCKPNRVGRFVASIMVKEIRNGVVIDSFARDFQYNVVDCDIPNPDMPFIAGTYDPKNRIGVYVECGDLTISFSNTSTNADRYEWNFGDPASGSNNTSTATNPTHTFSDTGTFIVTLKAFKKRTDGQLCLDSTRRICKIYPRAKVDFDYPAGLCIGQSASFIDKTLANSGKITQWSWIFGDGKTSTMQNPNNTYLSAGSKYVKLEVTTINGCKSDTTHTLVVYPKPTIAAIIPKGCVGQPMNLECNTTIPSPYSVVGYRWTLPNGTILTSCNVSFIPTTLSNGTLNLWAISDKGCADSINYSYVVNPLPIVRASNDTILCYDQNTRIVATGASTYQWTPTSYLDNPSISNPIASPPYPDSITYTVKGTDANGCYNFDSVKIKFYTKSFIDAGPDTSICLPPSVAQKTWVQLNGQGSFSRVYWLPSATLNNANIANPIATPTDNTDYIFHGIDINNCLIRDTVRVTVLDPKIDLLLLKDTSICPKDSFLVTPKDQGNNVSSYTWSMQPYSSSAISNPNIRTPYLKPMSTTLFILNVKNYCYNRFDSLLVNVYPLPDVGLIDLDSICIGETYQFASNPNHVSYSWTTNEPTFSNKSIYNPTAKPLISQNYILKVIDRNGCTNTDSIQLLVHPLPYTTVLGVPRFLCQGDTIQLKVLTNQICKYSWLPNIAISSDTAQTINAYPMDTTRYYIRATNIHNCTTLDSFKLNVQKPIRPYALRPVRICKGKFIDLYAEGGLYYLWKPFYQINDTLSQTPQVSPEHFFTYTVFISNDCFMDSLKVDVYVDSLPKVDLGRDTLIYRGQEITLTATTQAERIEWFPKRDYISNPFVNSIYVSPRDTTRYWVEATNSLGCVGRDSINVFVYGKNVLLVPTGFSPNGDGINDEFRIIRYLNIATLNKFEVYNRWGELIYSSTNIKQGWDGKYKGENSPAGTYVWQVEAYSYDGDRIVQSGNVTLIR